MSSHIPSPRDTPSGRLVLLAFTFVLNRLSAMTLPYRDSFLEKNHFPFWKQGVL